MALPTLTVTPGSGATVNTLPPGGQAAMASSLPVAIASDQSTLPVSFTSQPLPAGASTSALQGTTNTSLAQLHTDLTGTLAVAGNIAKFQAQFGPASSTTYAAGQVMSAPIQATGIGRVAGGSGVITGAALALAALNTVEVDLVLMTSAPAGTYAAGAAYPNVPADRAKISQVLKVTDWSALSPTDSVGEVVPASKMFTCDDATATQSLWVIPVARGSVTLASATDATLTLRASRN